MTEYGQDVILKVVLLLVLLSALTWIFGGPIWLKYLMGGLSLAIFLFTLYFFRDPERVTPSGSNLIMSPADGKVVLIKNLVEDEYLHQEATQISVFLSPLDVHVNRFPISGTVEYYRYVPGKYLVAFEDKASEANERTHIGISHPTGKVLFKQIAGFVARRIVANVQIGMSAEAGKRFGMIKFGSRVDVIVPKSAAIHVKLGERVVAGETVLAEFHH